MPTHHSKVVFRRAANIALRHNSNCHTSRDEDENDLQEVQSDLALLDIALRYPSDRHVCFYGPLAGARGALLWTMGEKVLCLRGSALSIRAEGYGFAVGVADRLRVFATGCGCARRG